MISVMYNDVTKVTSSRRKFIEHQLWVCGTQICDTHSVVAAMKGVCLSNSISHIIKARDSLHRIATHRVS